MDLSKYSDASKYPAYPHIDSNFGYFLKNLIKDLEVSEADKEKCLETLCSLKISNANDLEGKCIEYFNNNKLLGSACANVGRLNPFIRIHTKDSFISWVSQIIGLKPEQTKTRLTHLIYAGDDNIKEMLLRSLLNSIAVNDSYMIEQNCLKYFGIKKWRSKTIPRLKDAHISNFNFIQWSFPKPTTEDIFYDQATIENLGCRAGLIDNFKKMIFQHTLKSSYKVKKPTVFDAGFYVQFEPGGKTKPLKKCDHLSGFDEYVHIPNNFSNLETDFFEILNP